jgi:hypothetical protein
MIIFRSSAISAGTAGMERFHLEPEPLEPGAEGNRVRMFGTPGLPGLHPPPVQLPPLIVGMPRPIPRVERQQLSGYQVSSRAAYYHDDPT